MLLPSGWQPMAHRTNLACKLRMAFTIAKDCEGEKEGRRKGGRGGGGETAALKQSKIFANHLIEKVCDTLVLFFSLNVHQRSLVFRVFFVQKF